MIHRILFGATSALTLLACLVGHGAVAAPLATPLTGTGTQADPGVINQEQILYWLIKRGEIDADASEADKQAAITAFAAKAGRAQPKAAAIEQALEKQRLANLRLSVNKRSAKGLMQADAMAAADVSKTVKVLGVLIDFPDLPFDANRLTAGDTGMYYPSYPASHYRNLLFSTTGFKGPGGQNLLSGYQYFQQVSGQTFSFTGDVKGWFRADNAAAYYGGNDATTDDDKAVQELVIEAVTKAMATMSAAEIATYDVEDPYDYNGNGNLEEADGVIDHVMLFHSSIGEEAGGGVLAEDAIWSHRFFVANEPIAVTGTSKKLFGYTVQPIDAAAGVCTHEFGHDLGLPDEYDSNNEGKGSPVGSWSLMSGGSWAGSIPGSQPTGFSPYAASYLQQRYQGNWIRESEISLDSLNASGLDLVLNQAIDHDNVNQLSIPLPAAQLSFKAPFEGDYQYYSGQGNLLNNALSFDVSLPSLTPLTLSMQAHWSIEVDYDYMQLLVNGVPIAGNHTKASNTVNGARNIITGNSANKPQASGADHWVNLSYDLSAYAGRNVSISVIYKTDEAEGDYGIAIDKLAITQGSTPVYSDGAEQAGTAMLAGFSRITDTRPGKAQRYLIQLRSHQGVDVGLKSEQYEPGVLIWLENLDYEDNNVSTHPGYGLIGVIDADQNLIGTANTDTQIRDAAFSLFAQKAFPGDKHLSAVSQFDDSQDYSAPLQPQSGMVIPKLGLTLDVLEQTADSSRVTLRLRKSDGSIPEPPVLAAAIDTSIQQGTVGFSAQVTGGQAPYSYAWTFGVANAGSTAAAPSYTYGASGSYTVSLTVTDAKAVSVTTQTQVQIAILPKAGFSTSTSNLQARFTNSSTGGVGALSYSWNFGDGQTSTAASPTHNYSAAGSYDVTLAVVDSAGNTSLAQARVTVQAAITDNNQGNSGSNSGGSLGWLSVCALLLAGLRRRG